MLSNCDLLFLSNASALPEETRTLDIVFSAMLGIRRDHQCRRTEMKFCMVAGLQEVVLRFEFYQNQLGSFGAVRGQNWPFPTDLAKSTGKGKCAFLIQALRDQPITMTTNSAANATIRHLLKSSETMTSTSQSCTAQAS